MKKHSHCAFGFLAARFSLVLLFAAVCTVEHSGARSASVHRSLYLLSAEIGEPAEDSDATPVVLYRAPSDGKLASGLTVLQGVELADGMHHRIPAGVYSVHEIGSYLLLDYPYEEPVSTIFIAKEDPLHPQSLDFNPKGLSITTVDHSMTKDADGTVCDLWQLVAGENGVPLPQTTTLHSACEKPGAAPFLETDRWDEYNNPQLDGFVHSNEYWLLTVRSGQIMQLTMPGQGVTITNAPPEYDGPAVRGVSLEAASDRYFVVGIHDKDGRDHNTNVFVKTLSDGMWKKLPVLPVAATDQDMMYYRLFDDWLVTSASAALLANTPIQETVVPNVLTVVETGKRRDDLGVAVDPRTAPKVAKLSARRIILWNLADGRRIDLAIPDDDSEIVHVFDGHSVLLRIHDKLFFAEIHGWKLTDYKLAAYDSAIPHVHWAFYSSSD